MGLLRTGGFQDNLLFHRVLNVFLLALIFYNVCYPLTATNLHYSPADILCAHQDISGETDTKEYFTGIGSCSVSVFALSSLHHSSNYILSFFFKSFFRLISWKMTPP